MRIARSSLAATLALSLLAACAQRVLPPVAVIAPVARINAGSFVQLDGTQSHDGQARALAYDWSFSNKPVNSQATLSDPHSRTPSFLADAPGDYVVQLVVSNSVLASAPAFVTVTASKCGVNPPVVHEIDASVQTPIIGNTVQLTAMVTDDDNTDACGNLGKTLTYAWKLVQQPGKSSATLNNASSQNPSLTVDASGDFVVRLVVTDSTNIASDAKDYTVKVKDCGNAAPTVVASVTPTSTKPGAQVQLSAVPSDADLACGLVETFSYEWTVQERPAGSNAVLVGATTVNPTFTPDLAGTYVFAVVSTDSTGLPSQPAFTTLSVSACGLLPPTIHNLALNAGSPPVDVSGGMTVGTQVTAAAAGVVEQNCLVSDGLASEKYLWSLKAPPSSAAALSNLQAVSPMFTPDVAGTYVLSLQITNSQHRTSDTAYLTTVAAPCTVSQINFSGTPITAVQHDPDASARLFTDGAGNPKPHAGATLTMAAHASVGAYCGAVAVTPLKYAWTIPTRPGGSRAAFDNSFIAAPSFEPDVPGTYQVAVVVSDQLGNSSAPQILTLQTTSCGVNPAVTVLKTSTVAGLVPLPSNVTVRSFDPYPLIASITTDDNDLTKCPARFAATSDAAWSIAITPPGGAAVLSDVAGPSTTFTGEVAGLYTVEVKSGVTGLFGRMAAAPIFAKFTVGACGANPPKILSTAVTQNDSPVSRAALNQPVTIAASGYDADAQAGCALADGGTPGGYLTYAWTLVSVPAGSTLTALNQPPDAVNTFNFTPDLAGTYVYSVVATDDRGLASPPAIVTVATGSCGPAVSDFNVSEALKVGSAVNVTPPDGIADSCIANPVLSYSWSMQQRPLGSNAFMVIPNVSSGSSFVPDVAGDYLVQLVVSDQGGFSTVVAKTIHLGPCNSKPVLANGRAATSQALQDGGSDHTIYQGSTVTLAADATAGSCGAGSSALSWHWQITQTPKGSNAALSSATDPTPNFIPDVAGGTFQISAQVTDALGNTSAPLVVTVNVSPCGSGVPSWSGAPFAVTQASGAGAFDPYTLTANAPNNPDNNCPAKYNVQAYSYSWQLVSPLGTHSSLSATSGSSVTFTPGANATYTIALVATTTAGISSLPATGPVGVACTLPGFSVAAPMVTAVTAPPGGDLIPNNLAPIRGENVGQYFAGDVLTLGTTITPGCLALSNPVYAYQWTLQKKPVGSTATLSSSTAAAPTLGLDLAGGTYELVVQVTDPLGNAVASSVLSVTVSTCGNNPLTVSIQDNAGQKANDPHSLVALPGTLDASGFCPTRLAPTFTYTWSASSDAGNAPFALSPTNAQGATFTPGANGSYTVQVTVNASNGKSATTTQQLVFNCATAPTLAAPAISLVQPPRGDTFSRLGPTVFRDDLVSLTPGAAASTCASGGAINYAWSLALPSGSATSLTAATGPSTSFLADLASGNYVVTLTATDSLGNQASKPVTVSTQSCGVNPLHVAMTDAAGAHALDAHTETVVPKSGNTTFSDDDNGALCPARFANSYIYSWSMKSVQPQAGFSFSSTNTNPVQVTPAANSTYDVQALVTASSGQTATPDVTFSPACTNASDVTISTAIGRVLPPLNDGFARQDNQGRPIVIGGDTIVLAATPASGCSSNPAFKYSWTLTTPLGSRSVLSSAGDASPTFVADIAGGTYTVNLTVSDQQGNQATATALPISVRTCGASPVQATISNKGKAQNAQLPIDPTELAVVGQYVGANEQTYLSADDDPNHCPARFQETYTYAWSVKQPASPAGSFDKPKASDVFFQPGGSADYTVQVAVTGSNGQSQTSTADVNATCNSPAVTLTVPQIGAVNPPAGDTSPRGTGVFFAGDAVTLGTGASTACSTNPTLTYAWTLVGQGSAAAFTPTTTNSATFVADKPSTQWTVTVTATDQFGNTSQPQQAQFSSGSCGGNPLNVSINDAQAGGSQAFDPHTLAAIVTTADASSACPTRFAPTFTYGWSAQPQNLASKYSLAAQSGIANTFSALANDTFTVSLAVLASNGIRGSATDIITANCANLIPTAAAPNIALVTRPQDDSLQLNGGAALKPTKVGRVRRNVTFGSPGSRGGGTVQPPATEVFRDDLVTMATAGTSACFTNPALTYTWALESKPQGSTATLTSTTAASPEFAADVASGSYRVSVQVADQLGNTSAPASSVVTVQQCGAYPLVVSFNTPAGTSPGNVASADTGAATHLVVGDSTTNNTGTLCPARFALPLDQTVFTFTQLSGPAGATFTPVVVNGSQTDFTPSVPGDYAIGVSGALSGLTGTDTAYLHVLLAPSAPVISAPAQATVNQQVTASVPAHAGMTYSWNLGGAGSNGTLSADGTINSVQFNVSGNAGPEAITCIEVNGNGTNSAPGQASINVLAAPAAPTITLAPALLNGFATAGRTYTATINTAPGVTNGFTIDSPAMITSAGGNAGVISSDGKTNSITFQSVATDPTALNLVASATNAAGTTVSSNPVAITFVPAPVAPAVTLSTHDLTASHASYQALVSGTTGAPYTCGITDGTITSNGSGTFPASGLAQVQLNITAGATVGTKALVVSCTQANKAGTSSDAGTASANVWPVPVTPAITSIAKGTVGFTYTASVKAVHGSTYAWTIDVGGITSAGGSAGVLSADGATNSIQYSSTTLGVLNLGVSETNGAGDGSATAGALAVTMYPAAIAPAITAPASVTVSSTSSATIPTRSGFTYLWGGVATGTTGAISFTAPSTVGPFILTVSETNPAGDSIATGSVSINAVGSPGSPAITLNPSNLTSGLSYSASATATSGMTYSWSVSGAAITSGGGSAGFLSSGNTSITFTAGAPGALSVGLVETNAAGTSGTQSTANGTVYKAPGSATVALVSNYTAGKSGYSAIVSGDAGMSYTCTAASNVTITAGATGTIGGTIGFTAGAAGTLTLSCTETNLNPTTPTTGPATLSSSTVVPAAASPITAPTNATTGRVYSASVPAHKGSTYLWTADAGIASPGGAAGVLSADGSTNSIQFNSGAVGTRTLTCVETNAAGDTEPAATATVNVLPAATAPVISMPAQITGSGDTAYEYVASAPIRPATPAMTYSWSIVGGHFHDGSSTTVGTIGGGVSSVTFHGDLVPIGSTSVVTLSCTETNAAADSSATGSASTTAFPPPVAPDIDTTPAPSPGVTAGRQYNVALHTPAPRPGMTYSWTITNGTFVTGTDGQTDVTTTGNPVTFNAGTDTTRLLVITTSETNAIGASKTTTTNYTVYPAPQQPAFAMPTPDGFNKSSVTQTVRGGPGRKAAFIPGPIAGLRPELGAPVLAGQTFIKKYSTAVTSPRPGFTYRWAISGGDLGPGVTTFTADHVDFFAGSTLGVDGMVLSVNEINGNGDTTAQPASAKADVYPAPLAPFVAIVANPAGQNTSFVTDGNVYSASLSRPDLFGHFTYSWQVTGGAAPTCDGTCPPNPVTTCDGTTCSSTFSSVANKTLAATFALSATETNAIGDSSSSPGLASATIVDLPVISSFGSDFATITDPSFGACYQSPGRCAAKLTGVFSGSADGTATITPGPSPESGTGVGVTVSPASTTAYTLTVTNQAGSSVSSSPITITVVPAPDAQPQLAWTCTNCANNAVPVHGFTIGDGATLSVVTPPANMTYLWHFFGPNVGQATLTPGSDTGGTPGVALSMTGAGMLGVAVQESNSVGNSSLGCSENGNCDVTLKIYAAAQTQDISGVPAQGMTVGTAVSLSVADRSIAGTSNDGTPFTYAWSVDTTDATKPGRGTFSSGGVGASVTFTPTTEGPVRIRVTEKNPSDSALGTATSAATSAIYLAPQTPVFASAFPSGMFLGQGRALAVNDDSSGNTTFTYQWSVDTADATRPGRGSFSNGGVGASVTFTPSTNGDIRILVTEANAAGAVSTAQVGLSTIAPAPTGSLSATPGTIGPTASVTLVPTFTGGAAVITNDKDSTSIPATSGTPVAVTPGTTTTYTLTVSNAAGSSAAPAQVNVVTPAATDWTDAWTNLSSPSVDPARVAATAVSVDKAAHGSLYLTAAGDVFTSTTGGAPWTGNSTPFSSYRGATVAHPGNGAALSLWADDSAAGVIGTCELYHSTDGANWTLVNSASSGIGAGLPSGDAASGHRSMEVVLDPSDLTQQTLYAIFNFPGSGVFKSTDDGVTWAQSAFTGALAGDHPQRVAVGQNGAAYVGTFEGNVAKLAGDAWITLAGTSRIAALAVDASNPAAVVVMAGTDTGSVLISTADAAFVTGAQLGGGPSTFTGATGGVKGLAFSSTGATYAVANGRFFKSTDHGATFTDETWTGVTATPTHLPDDADGYLSITVDPAQPQTVYVVSHGIAVWKRTFAAAGAVVGPPTINTLATGLNQPSDIAVDGAYAYVDSAVDFQSGQISAVYKSGGKRTDYAPGSGLTPAGLLSSGTDLYAGVTGSSGSTGGLYNAALGLGSATQVNFGAEPRSVAVDASGKIYFGATNGQFYSVTPPSTTAAGFSAYDAPVFARQMYAPDASISTNLFFCGTRSEVSGLYSAPRSNAGQGNTILLALTSSPCAFAGKFAYYSVFDGTAGTLTIHAYDLALSLDFTLASMAGASAEATAIAADSKSVYFGTADTIQFVDLTSSPFTIAAAATGRTGVAGLAIDSSTLYWTETGRVTETGTAGLLLSKAKSAPANATLAPLVRTALLPAGTTALKAFAVQPASDPANPPATPTMFAIAKTAANQPQIYRSTDAGLTWSGSLASFNASNCTTACDVMSLLAIDPNAPQVIYAAGNVSGGPNDGRAVIYQSLDGGNTWTRTLPTGTDQDPYSTPAPSPGFGVASTVSALAVGGQPPQGATGMTSTLYLGTLKNPAGFIPNGLLTIGCSSNGLFGSNFHKDYSGVAITSISVDGTGTHVFAGATGTSPYNGVLVRFSSGGFNTFNASGPFAGANPGPSIVATDPTKTDGTVYAVSSDGSAVYQSAGGNSWIRLSQVPAGVKAMGVDPATGNLFVSTSAGIFSATSSSGAFTQVGTLGPVTGGFAFAFEADAGNTMFGWDSAPSMMQAVDN